MGKGGEEDKTGLVEVNGYPYTWAAAHEHCTRHRLKLCMAQSTRASACRRG